MKHTPGPWRVGTDEISIIGEDGEKIHKGKCINRQMAERKANARFIVLACNLHDELVEALIVAEKAMIKLNDKLSEMGKGLDDGHGTPFDVVAVALAKARGE